MLRRGGGAPAPAVVIAHGFAGSQQLMLPFAVTLARAGYVAVSLDLWGHGRNPVPLAGSLTEETGATTVLVRQVADVVAWARALPTADGRIALLGHSMASDIVVRYAQADRAVAATVAVSMFAPGVTAASPSNLLVIIGELEPQALKNEALRVAAMASAGTPPRPGVTYGSLADGTARRATFVPGVEHVAVLYGRAGLEAAVAWLNATFMRDGSSRPDTRGPWLGLTLLGFLLLARPLAQHLPVVASRPMGAGLPWRRLLPVALAPAVLTPLLLWPVPTGFLPLLVGDYLALHFALYGLLTAAGLWLARRGLPPASEARPSWRRLAIAALLVVLYGVVGFALVIDRYVTAFLPIVERLPLLLALLAGTLPYCIVDEWATRGPAAPRGGYALTKLCFLLSLAAAVALDLERLFFLIIALPVILVLFLLYGCLSTWTYGRTVNPLVGALAAGLGFAWAIAVTFPLVAR